MEHNPYAPPSASSEPPPPGLVFTSEGIEVVASMAKWMRALSTFYYIALAFAVLGGGCATLGLLSAGGSAAGGIAVVMAVAMFAMLAMFGAAATWLKDAAGYFENGVLSDDEFTLGQGFRKLRAYLIMFGILGVLSLLSNISQAVELL